MVISDAGGLAKRGGSVDDGVSALDLDTAGSSDLWSATFLTRLEGCGGAISSSLSDTFRFNDTATLESAVSLPNSVALSILRDFLGESTSTEAARLRVLAGMSMGTDVIHLIFMPVRKDEVDINIMRGRQSEKEKVRLAA